MNIIKQLRLKAGLQQQELAAMLNVSKPTVSDWEHQRKNPRGENLKKLSEIFHEDELVILGVVPPAGSAPPNAPRTIEARIVSGGMDKLPKEQREQILAVVRAMFAQHPELFEKGDDDDA